jgi:hypothetical protein
MRFSTSGFFHESVSPKQACFKFFSKIQGNIRSSRCTIGVVDTSGKWEKMAKWQNGKFAGLPQKLQYITQ